MNSITDVVIGMGALIIGAFTFLVIAWCMGESNKRERGEWVDTTAREEQEWSEFPPTALDTQALASRLREVRQDHAAADSKRIVRPNHRNRLLGYAARFLSRRRYFRRRDKVVDGRGVDG